jgi:formiminotetrahydrofolate cyclodeaminase
VSVGRAGSDAVLAFAPDFGLETALAILAAPGTPAAAGSASALAGAAAASVLAKASAASGRPGEAAQAEALADRLAALAGEDAAVHGAARAALASAGEGQGSEQRDFSLGRLLRHASAVPREIAETCSDVALLAGGEAERVGPDLRADTVAAASLAAGAAAAAAHLVAVNLVLQEGDQDLVRARGAASAAADVVASLGLA